MVQTTTRTEHIVIPLACLIKMLAVAAVQNYHACLEEYDEDEMALHTEVANAVIDEISGFEARLGGGFDNTKELHVMKYEEAVNSQRGLEC